jgi:hypothetical protein
MDDAALNSILGPLLQKRPQLRASLLQAPATEDRRPSVDVDRHPSAGDVVKASSSAAVDVVKASFTQASQARAAKSSGTSAAASEREYRKSDLVYVFSNSAQRWCEGTVLQVSLQATGKIPQGSVEVSFELGQKWIAPNDAPRILRPR